VQCPACNATLQMMERQGVEIDYCSQCRGVWLDRGELDKILARSATMQGEYPGERPPRRAHGDDDDYSRRRRKNWLEDLFD